jgi:hypothetical protein
VIQTEAPGLSTEEVESLVSVPLENALNGTIGLKTIRSKSVLGLSSVVLILEEGSDLMAARQVVQEWLSVEAPRLPAAARPPVILSPPHCHPRRSVRGCDPEDGTRPQARQDPRRLGAQATQEARGHPGGIPSREPGLEV